ncbi:eae-like domain protein [Phytobacter diazotrophicus]|uniref:eae-like domain protein n=1 Tax=Phytobacter diazotrophicus TaxID=395631 RepID=UPI002935D581|nr:eae-like domain protein [Phytobacter diazotrophicus]MDV2874447.1 eae-like domain protein [Phytobacter diazotrophicus]
MKQVTMESVKQRIADLESAGKVVGGLSLSSEFELACLRELVAVTEQRDVLVVENVALKAVNDDRRVFIMNGVQLGFIKVPTVVTDPALETIRIAVSPQEQTPATEAAIAALRAEAIEKCADDMASENNIGGHEVDAMYAFARQLRESKGEVQS